MEPLFLAKLLGAYFLIMGIIVATKRSAVMPAMKDLSNNRGLILLIGVVELAAGLGIVLAYPRASLDWMGLISLIGYILVIESIVYLTSGAKFMKRMVKSFNKPSWYAIGGALSVVLGIYLLGTGFQLF